MFEQPLPEVDQGRGVKPLVAQLAVEGQVPASVVAQHLRGLPIRDRFQELQETYPQQQHRLDRHPPVVGTIAALQGAAGCGQYRIDLVGKQPKAVGRPKEFAGKRGGGEKLGLT